MQFLLNERPINKLLMCRIIKHALMTHWRAVFIKALPAKYSKPMLIISVKLVHKAASEPAAV